MRDHAAEITLGPILFNWQPERWRDFYFGIADEASISTVYLGEVVCSKREALFAPYYDTVIDRLTGVGKTVVLSTLSEVMLKRDREIVEIMCAREDALVEANDSSALFHLQGRPHRVGPFMNVYNEEAVAFLASRGALNFCLPPELPAAAIGVLCERARSVGATIEVQVFGRVSLALSARCYHARAHGHTRDSCQFVCENDPDGLDLQTLDDRVFLTVNGLQVLSYSYLNLIRALPDLRAMGVARFRLSPHSLDMRAVAATFRAVLDGQIAPEEGAARLNAMALPAPFADGFFHGRPGYGWSGGERDAQASRARLRSNGRQTAP